jgi:sirohydrochlorin cobaltochelatase
MVRQDGVRYLNQSTAQRSTRHSPPATGNAAAVLVGHGSLLADSGKAMMEIASQLRQQQVLEWVEAGFLNFSQPTCASVVARVKAQGAHTIVMQPYFLIDGYYVLHELAALVDSLAAEHPQLSFKVAAVLGDHPALIQLACKRLATVDPAPDSQTGLLFAAHGTPLPAANGAIERVLAAVQQQMGYGPATVGYLECNEPDIAAAFARLVAVGVTRITVLPYFLHLGRHVRKDLPKLFAAARQTYHGVPITVAHHLDYDPLLVEIVADRIRSAALVECNNFA